MMSFGERAGLTFEEFLPHQVIVHGFCYDPRNVFTLELHEGETFTAPGLKHTHRQTDAQTYTNTSQTH